MKMNLMMKKFTMAMVAATMILGVTACGSSKDTDTFVIQQEYVPEENPHIITTGSGENEVAFTIRIATGEVFHFELKTAQTTVGAALNEEGVVSITADGTIETALHNEPASGASWTFYVDGVVSETNILETPIEDGREYSIGLE